MEDGVGKTLRDARSARGLDLAQVEASTRIRARFLRALEEEDWGVLPGETYARAFIRTYADFLGLDGVDLAERYRRRVGGGDREERLPRVEPDPIAPAERSRRRQRLPPRALAVVVTVALVAVAIVVGVTSGDGGDPGMPAQERGVDGDRASAGKPMELAETPKPGMSLQLTAIAEVWVCLLDSRGEPLVDGQILSTGGEAGPFRSDSFTVSFGNGEVSMKVNGQQASIPATSSPIGYSIGAGGNLSQLSESERPTCT